MFRLTLNLYRYLFILKSTSTLAIVPRTFSAEFSYIVGNAIADRLPTVKARPWRKSLKQWENPDQLFLPLKKQTAITIPPNPWPIEAVILHYPCRASFGKDERLLIEIKLIGKSADHGFFLEEILPTVEDLGRKPPALAGLSNRLWGSYEIDGVYISAGNCWRPLAEDGCLDLGYNPKPNQWLEGLSLVRSSESPLLDKITWFTPYAPLVEKITDQTQTKTSQAPTLPTLKEVLDQFMIRLKNVTPGKRKTKEFLLDGLSDDERLLFDGARDIADRVKIRKADVEYVNSFHTRMPFGVQTLATAIPDHLIPFLSLASILQVGQYTHYGCGAFIIE